MIYLGADHRGYDLKNHLKAFLSGRNTDCMDLGSHSLEEEDDYPDYAVPVAEKVSVSADDLGILICASGIGVCVAANKFKNVRAGICVNEWMAIASKEDDNINVLCLPSDIVSEKEADNIVVKWLEAKFKGTEKYQRRLNKIKKIEDNNFK